MFFRILAALLVLPLLTQCGSQPAPEVAAVTGPFDHSGNYVEDWADAPDRWLRPSAPASRPQTRPVLAKREPAPEPPAQVIEVITQPDRPTRTQPASVIARPAPNVVKVTSAPKPKPAAKPAAKPKPEPTITRYTVKKGDNLGRIASRHSASLSAIRKANGIKGDLIRPGQVLTIPK